MHPSTTYPDIRFANALTRASSTERSDPGFMAVVWLRHPFIPSATVLPTLNLTIITYEGSN